MLYYDVFARKKNVFKHKRKFRNNKKKMQTNNLLYDTFNTNETSSNKIGQNNLMKKKNQTNLVLEFFFLCRLDFLMSF